MRYQGDIGPNGNRGKIVAISEVAEGAFHYTVETASGRRHTDLCDDTLSAQPVPVPTIETAVRVLNEALKADQLAITRLINHREACNDALADHPTVQVSSVLNPGAGWQTNVGALGILNGVLEAMTGERVMAVYDDSGSEVVEFRVYARQPEEASQ